MKSRPRLFAQTSQKVFLVFLTASLSMFDTQAEELSRLKYNHPGLAVDLGVGLYSRPMPMDYDGDGDYDLVISTPDKPNRKLYFFENPGGDKTNPVFKAGVVLDKTVRNLQVSYIEGSPRVLSPNVEYDNFLTEHLGSPRKLPLQTNIHSNAIRANLWKYVDYEADGDLDLLIGVEDWTDYGWDDSFNKQGQWTNGPLHGYVYLVENLGTDKEPNYAKPTKIKSDGKVLDVYGMPSPSMVDFDNDGDLDLMCGEFVDRITYFENVGSRQKPEYAKGQFLKLNDQILHIDSCMFVPVAFDWDRDGDADLIYGQEDGRVAWLENLEQKQGSAPRFADSRFFQQEADAVKYGVLSTPINFDWDNDGDEDLICGNASGRIGFLENLGGNPPKWAAFENLKANGQEIRIQAGINGSIQGPCESKWGYTTLNIADWNHDGLPDVMVNSIWGKILWYRNTGKPGQPVLAAAQPVQIDWRDQPRSPAWNWWHPEGNNFVTQWRTSIPAIDITGDGNLELVAIDDEGYIALFEQLPSKETVTLRPGKRMFYMKEATENTFNCQQQPLFFDLDEDKKNDLSAPSDPLVTTYFHTLFMQGRKTTGAKKHRKPLVDDRYQDPNHDSALRLTAGWAGRGGRRKFTLSDWDGDGKIDLLVNSMNINFLRNISEEPTGYVFKDLGPVSSHKLAGHTTCPTVVDWDKNGVPDLLIGAEDGYFYYLQNPRSTETEKAK